MVEKCLWSRCSLKLICISTQMSTKVQPKEAKWNGMQDIPIRELLLEDLKLLRVRLLFYIFLTDPIWPFFTHSLNLLEQDVLLVSPSPWLKSLFFPPSFSVQKPQHIACLVIFLPDFIRHTAQKPAEALCLFHNCGWVKIHLPGSPLPSLLAKSRPPAKFSHSCLQKRCLC